MQVRAKVAALEFAGDEVRLAVVRTGSRLPKVIELHACGAAYEQPEQREEALIEAVLTVLKQMRSRPAGYVLCVSSAHSVVRTLTIPFRGARKVAAAVPFELEPYLAFPIEELLVDFNTVLDREGQTDVLAVGIRRAVIQEQLAIVNAAGIDPEGVDVDATGLTGLWRGAHPELKGLHAVLHVREEGCVLGIVFNKTLAYFRHLIYPAAKVRDNPSAAGREVQNSLRAFLVRWRGGGEVGSLTVTGNPFEGEEWAEAREKFEREIDVPVSYECLLVKIKAAALVPKTGALAGVDAGHADVIEDSAPMAKEPPEGPSDEPEALERFEPIALEDTDPLSALASVGETFEPIMPERPALRRPAGTLVSWNPAAERASDDSSVALNRWESVVGGAMGAAGNGFALNFRKGDLAYKNALRGVVPQVLAAACLALLLLAGVAWFYYDARGRNLAEAETLRGQIAQLESEVVELQGQGVNVPTEMFSAATLLDVLNDIASRMPDQKVTVTEIRVDHPETAGSASSAAPWITIRGEVKDDGSFSAVLDDLRKSNLFQIEEPERKLDGAKSTFRIIARRKQGSGSGA